MTAELSPDFLIDSCRRLGGILAATPAEIMIAAGYPAESEQAAALAAARPSRKDWRALRSLLDRRATPAERRAFLAAWREQLDVYIGRTPWLRGQRLLGDSELGGDALGG